MTDAKAVIREATHAFLADSGQVDEMLEALAEGLSLKALCKALGVNYVITRLWLAKNRPDEYDAARLVRADAELERIAELEEDLENRRIGWNEFRELTKSKQWRAERLNPKRYGQRQTVDMNFTDKTRSHMEALREMARRPVQSIEARQVEALPNPDRLSPTEHIDAQFTVVTPPTPVTRSDQ